MYINYYLVFLISHFLFLRSQIRRLSSSSTTSMEEVPEVVTPPKLKKTVKRREPVTTAAVSSRHEPKAAVEPTSSRHESKASGVPTSSSSKKRKHPRIEPHHVQKPSAYELFGTDSEVEEEDDNERSIKKGNISRLYSYYTRRLPRCFTYCMDKSKLGSYYITLKVFKTDDIESVEPTKRLKKALYLIRNKTDSDTEAWKYLSEFITATCKEYESSPKFYY